MKQIVTGIEFKERSINELDDMFCQRMVFLYPKGINIIDEEDGIILHLMLVAVWIDENLPHAHIVRTGWSEFLLYTRTLDDILVFKLAWA